MNTYNLCPAVSVECSYHKTRNGFRHEAVLWVDGSPDPRVKINYINRTWESFKYQSVIHKAILRSRTLGDERREQALAWQGPRDNFLSTVGAAAAVLSLLCEDRDDANRAKASILRAVPGIEFPSDWDSLSAEEQQRRLDGAIAAMK